jgi:hypothetical protein
VDPTDDERLLENLEDLLEKVLASGITPSENTTLVAVNVPEAETPLPALQLTLTDDI